MDIQENVPLSLLTTFKIGGPARFLITINSENEIPGATAFAAEKDLPLVPLGSGSNMLAPDEGAPAVFVRLVAENISVEDEGPESIYTADAGVLWDTLVAHAVSDGAWGMENLSAIPGTVGAAVVQNIGAYGAALSDVLESVGAFDMRDRSFKAFANNECRFGYRTSIFKEERDRYFITEVTFRLSKTPSPNLSYRDLKNRFVDTSPSLSEIRDAIVEIRKGKFPPLSEFGTAGSFFLNPIIAEGEVAALHTRYPDMPVFILPEGGVKVPLAWLFDHVLDLKGMREGKAFVWDKQPLVLAAEPGARSADVHALAKKIAEMLRKTTGIAIIPEVRAL